MDELKDSTQAASFEQKDPLVVYKMEAYKSFEELVYKVNYDVMSYLMGGKLLLQNPEEVREAKTNKTDLRKTRTNKDADAMARRRAAASAGRAERAKPETFKRQDKKVKRNDPCPCGSGKKYKQCHGN